MPYTHELYPREKYALVTAEGPCDLDQTIVALRTLVRDPGFGAGFGVLVDARRIEYTPGAEETRQIATLATHRDLLLHHPLAIAAEQDLNYGIARMFSAMSSLQGGTVEVFRDLKEARAWLITALETGRARGPSETGEET